jgi:hypothetical protein
MAHIIRLSPFQRETFAFNAMLEHGILFARLKYESNFYQFFSASVPEYCTQNEWDMADKYFMLAMAGVNVAGVAVKDVASLAGIDNAKD